MYDHGGWTGGEFVLGGSGDRGPQDGLSRREIMARAAEERMSNKKRIDEEANEDTPKPSQ